jgi:hypothetical protein
MTPSRISELENYLREQQAIQDERTRQLHLKYRAENPDFFQDKWKKLKKKMNEDPEYADKVRKRQRESYHRAMLDPEKKKKRLLNHKRNSRRSYERDLQDPDRIAKRRAQNLIHVRNYRNRKKNE